MDKITIKGEVRSRIIDLQEELNHILYQMDEDHYGLRSIMDDLECQTGAIQAMVELLNENYNLLEDEENEQ